jgi:hypothetical protein
VVPRAVLDAVVKRKIPESKGKVAIRWAPCHHGMARPQVADGRQYLQKWRVAANILNKQSRRAHKGL